MAPKTPSVPIVSRATIIQFTPKTRPTNLAAFKKIWGALGLAVFQCSFSYSSKRKRFQASNQNQPKTPPTPSHRSIHLGFLCGRWSQRWSGWDNLLLVVNRGTGSGSLERSSLGGLGNEYTPADSRLEHNRLEVLEDHLPTSKWVICRFHVNLLRV